MRGEAGVKCLFEVLNHRLSVLSRWPSTRRTFDRERVHHLQQFPISQDFDLPVLLRHAKNKPMDERASPGNFVFNS